MSKFSNQELLKIIKELLPDAELTGEINLLSGGNINFVWRAGGIGKNLIIKHAPSHIATDPSVPLSAERIDFEARVLKILGKGGRLHEITEPEIRPPELYAYDPEHSLIIMEDVGDFMQLGEAISRSGSPQKMGKRLGELIGSLHRNTFKNRDLKENFHNIEIQKVRNQLQYQPAHENLNTAEDEVVQAVKEKCQDLGKGLLSPGKCLVMGDLWPPSIFVGKNEELRLIDWEFVHFGRPMQDLAHFAAHCWMQGQVEKSTYHSSEWENLWKSFLKAYKVSTGLLYDELLNKRELEDIGVHIGAEILIRTFGQFKSGYLYESFPAEHKLLREAKKSSLVFISDSEATRNVFEF